MRNRKPKQLWEAHGPAEMDFIYLFFKILFFKFFYVFFICGGFCHTLKWISHGFACVPHPDPPPTSLSTRSLWVFPVHRVRALVSCIQPGLVICFTLDNIQVSMLSSWTIPPSPSPTESKRLFYKSVSFFFFFCSEMDFRRRGSFQSKSLLQFTRCTQWRGKRI